MKKCYHGVLDCFPFRLDTTLLGESDEVDGGELGALGRLGSLAVRGRSHFPVR
jgi:hypothetical protein